MCLDLIISGTVSWDSSWSNDSCSELPERCFPSYSRVSIRSHLMQERKTTKCKSRALWPTFHHLTPAFTLTALLFQERQQTDQPTFGLYNPCYFNFSKAPCNIGKQLWAPQVSFDCKTHRSFLLTRVLFFHTQMTFLCKMYLGQMSNIDRFPMVLYPFFFPMKAHHLI